MKAATKYLAAIAAIAAAASASAVPTLYLSDGVASVTVVDGGIGDVNPDPGAVTYIGGVGTSWIANVSTGQTDPALNPPFPHLDINSVDNTSSAGGTLTIRWSDDGFAATSGNAFLSIGGTLAPFSSLTFNVYGDGNGTIPANGGTLLGSLSFSNPTAVHDQPFSGATSGLSFASLGNDFSVTEEIILTHGGAGSSSFDGALSNVPEGGATLILLGSGLTVLGFLRRKIAKA